MGNGSLLTRSRDGSAVSRLARETNPRPSWLFQRTLAQVQDSLEITGVLSLVGNQSVHYLSGSPRPSAV